MPNLSISIDFLTVYKDAWGFFRIYHSSQNLVHFKKFKHMEDAHDCKQEMRKESSLLGFISIDLDYWTKRLPR